MGQFIHLDPEERKEIIENIVDKLDKRLTDAVKKIVGDYAITEPEILERVSEAAAKEVDAQLQKRLRSTWFRRVFFK
jgi:dihydrodipicolinate synthase/N-acetylneuraminate lyase